MSQAGIVNLNDVPLPPDIPTSFVTDNGTATPSANILQIKGSIGITTAAPGSVNLVTISVETGGFAWSYVSGDLEIEQQDAFVALDTTDITLTPTTGGVRGDLILGDMVFIYVATANGVTVTANSGQKIQVGSETSITAGTISSSVVGSMVQLFFSIDDSTWHSISPQGSWEVQTS